MSLSDCFPDSFKKSFIEQKKIKVSDVLFLHCDFTTPPKKKYLVVCCCDPLLVLVINSEIHPFIQSKDYLLECQVDILKEDHDFLKWDSYVSCIEAHQAFNLQDVKSRITHEYASILVGNVAPYCMRSVYQAVSRSKSMTRKHKKLILESLSEFQ
ncbi:hypothetical protein AB7V82_12345 [Providencia stuartii]|uniref:hypothetical protein n=1 Tax=Providencia stuartii TaxID=588 RepID=UPI0034E60AE8